MTFVGFTSVIIACFYMIWRAFILPTRIPLFTFFSRYCMLPILVVVLGMMIVLANQ